ncbi:MAG TPA: hypothetical protein VNS46_05760 [Nocardioides sp.]|nr:hypothetical protein [Nocardioides sp.]
MGDARDTELAERTRVVLDAAARHVFGTEPGLLAAELYDVLVRTTDDGDRARVAAALARCWSYAGRADRAAEFADEALERAERTGDAALVADCLDAVLACHWGPDELALRRTTAARLDEVAAHVLDPQARLQAHLWSLQVACETLHVPAIRRQLRALDQLAEESPRARFFAASRRWMYDMLCGRTDRAHELIAVAEESGAEVGLADAWMVVASMRGFTALREGDTALAAELGEGMERFARDEGIVGITAVGAAVWAKLGDPDRVRSLLHELGSDVLEALPRDFDFLVVLQCTLEGALFVADVEVARTAARLLAPYEGRAVVDSGAVYVYGVTDDTLARAAALLGDPTEARRLREQALATYQRIGATWWHDRLAAWQPTPAGDTVTHFRRSGDGLWLVGPGSGTPMRALRGHAYLHRLLLQPGRAVSAVDLVTESSGTVVQPDTGPLLDRTAATAYRARLGVLDGEIGEAEEWSDLARVEALRAEREALLTELRSAAGWGGRARVTGSTSERARVAATKAITTAIDRIAAVDPLLADHLRDAVRTGTECVYRPLAGAERSWVLAGPPG